MRRNQIIAVALSTAAEASRVRRRREGRTIVASAATLVLVFPGVSNPQSFAPGAVVERTYDQSKEAPRPKPPVATGRPNIIWILLDDAGFAASSAFGGVIDTPTFDKLADGGLRFTNFHDPGVCSPTRAALLTGRNHHKVGMGMFPHAALSAGFPGYSGFIEPKDATVAAYLSDAGYTTYALGKWHLTPDEEASDVGPFNRWPLGMGFEHFFGFLGGAADQYKPDLVEDDHHVKGDGHHLNQQLVDKAIAYIDTQEAINPAKPFFMYLATGATHAPHQVGRQWIDKYGGKFDGGWDLFRQQVLARQKALGLIPANAVLPPRDPRVPEWNSLTTDQKRIYARFMEAYAGYLEYTDHELGRLVDHLRETGLSDRTAIFVMIGDNGASKEGGHNGFIHGDAQLPKTDDAGQLAEIKQNYDKIGTADALSNYPIGWAEAANTPFRMWKADADSEGGTRNPLIVNWPGHVQTGIRTQYSHSTDMLPTTLELAGVSAPATERNVQQDPLQGVSLAYAFSDASAATRHRIQYYYLFGSGSIVEDGWKASFHYRPDPIDVTNTFPPPKKIENKAGKEVWELYDLNHDFNEMHDLAKTDVAKLNEMKALFDSEAKANNVYPLVNWSDIWNHKFMMMANRPDIYNADQHKTPVDPLSDK